VDSAALVATLGVDYDAQLANVVGYNVRTWNPQSFALNEAIVLPRTPVSTATYLSEGRVAAFNTSGTMLYAITQSSTGTGVVYTLYQVPM
jgi:hypothetical protein